MRSLPARHCQFCSYNIMCSGWLMAKTRYMDIILLVSVCLSLCIRSSGMLALLSQMSQYLSMGTCIHDSMWVQVGSVEQEQQRPEHGALRDATAERADS